MKLRANGVRRARSCRIEALEDRSLLSAAALSLAPADVRIEAASANQALRGTINGNFALSGDTVGFAGKGSLGATGEWTLTGRYTVSENVKTHKLTVSGGSGTATDSAGERLSLEFTGSGKGISTFKLSFKGTVTGGTGHYQGATGTFSASATATDATGTFAEKVTIKAK